MMTDVLIAGGGLSGLALADHLTRRGVDHLVIEAGDRLGGRILTRSIAGAEFDLGPAWFWPGQQRMAALAERFDIPVFEQFATGDLMFQDQSGAAQRGRGFASMQGSCRLAGGMGRLVDALAASLAAGTVQTGARLTALKQTAEGFRATLQRGGTTETIDARRVALALPPRVIADTVRFDPGLSAAQLQALREVPTWMAGQAKILAVYDQPHWRRAGLSGDAMSQRGPLVEIHDASPMEGGPYALFGFVGVPADMRSAHEKEMMALVLSQLTALFGDSMAVPRDLVLQDWATLPEIARPQDRAPVRSHPSYGLPDSLRALTRQGLHFTSTETAPAFGGFLEGALEAAERTTGEILQPAAAEA